VNPMRLAGGLLGGSWLLHLITDLADGRLDAAWLVQNFEYLNPANALRQKYYHVFEDIDSERERYLEFERWWNGYYFLSQEEILAIVQNLFIGNQLERGELRIDDCCYVNLRHIRNPLLIFASSADNITPPHQALNWIPTVYPSTEELKAAGQRIVYLLNTRVGHLGIFVSADVARQEHRAILENVGRLEALSPGLYEMKIDRPASAPSPDERRLAVHFEERQVEQIRYDYPKTEFEKVRAVSEWNEAVYQRFVSPLDLVVRQSAWRGTAEMVASDAKHQALVFRKIQSVDVARMRLGQRGPDVSEASAPDKHIRRSRTGSEQSNV